MTTSVNLLLLIVLAAVILASLGVLVVLVVLVAGIRAEERHLSLTGKPRTRAGSAARHLLGVGLRQPRDASRCTYPDRWR